ncbi:sensor domain-containing protein [Mycobacterium sp.]|uniref:sensor domain-containing protein n=1 Tax=Mycobacterium sp. TaxID=1785 RepID=UPI0025E0A11B|nr:sensor domain-containing protein [Mycobacterium sp.]
MLFALEGFNATVKGEERMRQVTAAVCTAAIGFAVAGCGGSNESSTASSSTTPARPPVAQAALSGLLLTPAEIDGVLGVTGTQSKEKTDKLQDDTAKQQWPAGWKFPDDCVFAVGPGESPVYANSGYTAVSGDDDAASLPPGANEPDPEVAQLLVLFPSAKEANAFFTTSTQSWPACANRQFKTPAGPDSPEMNWQVGPVSNSNGTLTTTLTMTASNNGNVLTMTGQRALTVRNNIVVDVGVIRKDPPDLGVKVANQIAGKVDKQ